MDSKIPLYISALALFVAVVGVIFIFNEFKKLKTQVKDFKVIRNETNNLSGKVDYIESCLDSFQKSINEKITGMKSNTQKAVIEPVVDAEELPKKKIKEEHDDDEIMEIEEVSDDDDEDVIDIDESI